MRDDSSFSLVVTLVDVEPSSLLEIEAFVEVDISPKMRNKKFKKKVRVMGLLKS